MKIIITTIIERQCAPLYIYRKQNNYETFYNTESQTLFKNQDYFCYVLYTKSKTIYVTQFFMKMFNSEFIYKKHDTLRYITFLYTKSHTLRKKQDDLC